MFYRYLQALSIDVVLGACINTSLLAHLLQVQLSPSILFALASATWLIYTADHLADAQKLKDKALTFRYLFHYQYRNQLMWVGGIVLCLAILNVFYLPLIVIQSGGAVCMGVLVYFFFLKLASGNPSFFKELTIGLIYAIAIFLAPLSLYENNWNTAIYILFIEYFFLAMINLLVFSLFEVVVDEEANYSSLVRKLGKETVNELVKILILLLFMTIIICLYFYHFDWLFVKIQLCIFLMNLAFVFMIVFPTFFRKEEYYRILGDMAFLFPVVLLF